MKCEHLGTVMDIDPRQAANEHSCVNYLRRLGKSGMTQKALWVRVRARGLRKEDFQLAIDNLVERGIITRQTTNYTNSFVLRLVKPSARPKTPTVQIQEPLTTEVA